MIPSNLRNNKDYITWYIVSLYFVVMNFVPFTLLAILNGAIYKQVSKLKYVDLGDVQYRVHHRSSVLAYARHIRVM